MSLVLYDTKARAKREFVPIQPGRVGMYVCGPTVYDRAHIGNARPVIVFDVLYRLLRRLYGEGNVTYVRNITDVDDKINAAAAESGQSIADITVRTTKMFHDDMAALGALPPDHEPRATDHIDGMIKMAETLIAKDHAYQAEGHVLFHVPSMAGYGALSRRSQKDLIAGARVEVAPYKKNPADFVLWKPSSAEQPGWDSPWGRGRPGWHLECSVMSEKFLGVPLDIHGGGQDLIFPHHENERAQSLCVHDHLESFANYWVHNGFVVVEGEKMSKSLGNFLTVDDVLADVGRGRGEVARLLMLGTHYRKPLDWTAAGVKNAKETMDRWYRALEACGDVEPVYPSTKDFGVSAFYDALLDDLNTPKAIGEVHRQADAIFGSREVSKQTQEDIDFGEFKGRLLLMGQFLGLLQRDPTKWFEGDHDIEVPTEQLVLTSDSLDVEITETKDTAFPVTAVKTYGVGTAKTKDTALPVTAVNTYGGLTKEDIFELITTRKAARKAKNFAAADEIRNELAEKGIILEDKPDGTTEWRRA